jgi:integrase
MATLRKRKNGWQAEVRRTKPRPFYESRTFPTKGQAAAWATSVEADMHSRRAGSVARHTVAEACEKYRDEVSVQKRGAVWETRRLDALAASDMGKLTMEAADAARWRQWRDRRLAEVSPGTVLREWNLFSHVFTVAIKEWRWARENPLKELRRPEAPPARDRIPTALELQLLAQAFGEDTSAQTGRVWAAFRFSCETAMRAGEIVGLTWDRINGTVAELPMTKNGSARRVPLSPAAQAILASLPRDGASVFGLTSPLLDALWRKVRDRAVVPNLHFHDARAYAITQLAKRVDILTLARISGHKNLKMLQVYYRTTAEDIADMLAASAPSPAPSPEPAAA